MIIQTPIHPSLLVFCLAPRPFTTYNDIDSTSSSINQKSTRGYVMYLGVNLISQCYKKHPTIAKSSIEVEYKALVNVVVELIQIQSLLQQLRIATQSMSILHFDNICASYLAINPIFHVLLPKSFKSTSFIVKDIL